jgi:required for meiotic nuclear division protein 1
MELEKVKIVAYKLGEKIRLKNLVEAYVGKVYANTGAEVLIHRANHSFIYVQNYGEVAFSDCDEPTIQAFLAFVAPFVDAPIADGSEYKEDFVIEVNPNQPIKFDYNSLQLPELNPDVIKIVMVNVCQSAVMDYFTALSESMLSETAQFTRELEMRGKVSISKTKLMKFIGKVLNAQNRVNDNLYFLDAPEIVWDNEYLGKINEGLGSTFKLKNRFRELESNLVNCDNSLRTLSQLIQHRNGNRLEWIIILLILFEVLQALFGKYFQF